MTYPEHLRELYALAPKGIVLGLSRIREAAARLGDPHLAIPCVQIAGTNGKGSVCAMLAQAAKEAGLQVGLYTSPHLHRFTERIRINGTEVDESVLAPILGRVLGLTQGPSAIPLSFFEVATLAAFVVFSERKLDLVILEVGLGGRLDATSIAAPFATGITSIGLDHTAILGTTFGEIAGEKAAIAREGVPMVIGSLPSEAHETVVRIAAKKHAPVYVLGKDFAPEPSIQLPWPGDHQRENAAVAARLFNIIESHFPACTPSVFRRAVPHTTWPGRFEKVGAHPTYLLDGAHNMEATAALILALKERQLHPDTLIFGACADKPHADMLTMLRPFVKNVILAPPAIARAFSPGAVAVAADHVVANPTDALALSRTLTVSDGLVLVTGSFFVVSEIRAVLLGEKTDPLVGL